MKGGKAVKLSEISSMQIAAHSANAKHGILANIVCMYGQWRLEINTFIKKVRKNYKWK